MSSPRPAAADPDQSLPDPEQLVITTADSRELTAHLYRPAPAADAGRAALVVHPATGVDQHLYRGFACHAAERGLPTVIYDLRGSGLSEEEGDAADRDLLMSDWMLRDVPAATRRMRELFPGRRLLAVGHSVGGHGQAASFQEEPVETLAMIASHAGVTRTVRGVAERAKVWTVFNVVTPVSARLLGRVPVQRLGLGRSIPLGVMRQWSRWTRRAGYFFEDQAFDFRERFTRVRGPVLSMVFADDPWATREASDILLEPMRNADIQRWDVDPRAEGLETVGHMGFFRSRNAALWGRVLDWLEETGADRG